MVTPKARFRAEIEAGNIERYRSRPWTAIDLDKPWREAGRPTYANFDEDGGLIRARNAPVDGVSEISDSGWLSIDTATGQAFNWRLFAQSDGADDRQHLSPDDPSLSLPRETVLAGPGPGQDMNCETHSFYLEHQFTDDLSIEMAYNKQWSDSDAGDMEWSDLGLMGDPNQFLPDGTPNPHAGDYYIESTISKACSSCRTTGSMNAS